MPPGTSGAKLHVSIHPNVAGAGPGFDETALKKSLARELEGQGARVPPLRIEHLEQLPRTGLGKSPLIRTTLPRAHSPSS